MKNIVATAEKHIQAFSDTPKSFLLTNWNEKKIKTVCRFRAVLWIREDFNADPDPALKVNADLDPGIWYTKIVKILEFEKKSKFWPPALKKNPAPKHEISSLFSSCRSLWIRVTNANPDPANHSQCGSTTGSRSTTLVRLFQNSSLLTCSSVLGWRFRARGAEERIATPTWACFRAPTSLVPSPHISVWYPGKITNQSFSGDCHTNMAMLQHSNKIRANHCRVTINYSSGSDFWQVMFSFPVAATYLDHKKK